MAWLKKLFSAVRFVKFVLFGARLIVALGPIDKRGCWLSAQVNNVDEVGKVSDTLRSLVCARLRFRLARVSRPAAFRLVPVPAMLD